MNEPVQRAVIVDLRKMKSHYPQWRLTRSLPQIFEEIVASWRERLI